MIAAKHRWPRAKGALYGDELPLWVGGTKGCCHVGAKHLETNRNEKGQGRGPEEEGGGRRKREEKERGGRRRKGDLKKE